MIHEPLVETPQAPRLERARGATRRWTLQTSPLILIVGPPALVPDRLVEQLAGFGLRADIERHALSALVEVGRHEPGAVVVSLELDGVDCADWIRAVRRRQNTPIYLALGDGAVDDARAALEAGATGILSAPDLAFAVLKRVTERWRNDAPERPSVDHVVVGPLELDVPSFSLRLRGNAITLPLKEFELITCLMVNSHRVVSTDEIATWLWGSGADRPSQRAISSHLKKLRIHLGDASLIRTVHGQGYTVSHLHHA
jgi:two-component system response regulator RegX3